LVKGRVKSEARDADKLSLRVSKRKSEASQELELGVSSNHQTQDDEKKTIDPEKVKVPSGEILSKIRDAAVSGRRKKKTESELDQSNQVSPNEDSEPAKKRKETGSTMSKGKKRARETETSGKKGTNGKSSPAVLFVSFWPGSST
ncbi:hypothetical protein A2U01_0042007, partial [Trifolium medium]|nr:hypothetical protein [Trifolium medium]